MYSKFAIAGIYDKLQATPYTHITIYQAQSEEEINTPAVFICNYNLSMQQGEFNRRYIILLFACKKITNIDAGLMNKK